MDRAEAIARMRANSLQLCSASLVPVLWLVLRLVALKSAGVPEAERKRHTRRTWLDLLLFVVCITLPAGLLAGGRLDVLPLQLLGLLVISWRFMPARRTLQ